MGRDFVIMRGESSTDIGRRKLTRLRQTEQGDVQTVRIMIFAEESDVEITRIALK